LEDGDANPAVMADRQARPVEVSEEVGKLSITGDVSFLIVLFEFGLAIPAWDGENAGVQAWADEDFMVVDVDFASVVINVLVSGLAFVGAVGRTNPTQRDVSDWLGFVEISKVGRACLGCAIICRHVKRVGIKVGEAGAGFRLESGHTNIMLCCGIIVVCAL
jgi:hypothetical protein